MKKLIAVFVICDIVVIASAFAAGVRFGQDFRAVAHREKWPEGWTVKKWELQQLRPLCLRLSGRAEGDDGFTPLVQSGFCPKDAPVYWEPRLMKEPVEEGG